METVIDLREVKEERESSECRSVSAPTSPTSESKVGCLTRLGQRKGHHRVNFPEDNCIVTGYFEAPDPYQYVIESQTLESLMDSYQSACEKQNVKPIPRVLQQLEKFSCNNIRSQDLILKGERLDSRHCEALEEILKRVLFRMIDLDSCDLDCEGASALFDMIEFYESASHLCIANNKTIGVVGWQSLCRTLKKTSCLQYLNLRNTGLNEQILLIMGRAMRLGSHLVTIHLENAGLYGRRLAILVAALKLNTNLRELYLGDNKICSADGVQIGNLLRANACLDVLDLRRNHIQDIGLDHICEGLAHQPYGGLKILNLCDNQLTSRGMNPLSQSLSMCRSLIGLNLSHNSLCNDGIAIIKEGLLQCKTLKYLNLSFTNITCEGAIAIAEVIADNKKIAIVDLSGNNIKTAGLMAICLSMKHNRSIVQLSITETQPSTQESTGDEGIQSFKELLEELDGYCSQNKLSVIQDEYDEMLRLNIESPLKETEINDSLNGIFSTQSVFGAQPSDIRNDLNNDSLESDGSQIGSFRTNICRYDRNENEMKPDVISNVTNGSHSQSSVKPDIISIQESLSHGYRKPVQRTVSLGSWDSSCDSTHKQSGRFSVSPVNLDIEPENNTLLDISNDANSRLGDTKAEKSIENTIDTNEDNKNDSINESTNETDELMDLPTNLTKNLTFLLPELPYKSTCRRMSTPSLSLTAKPKPRQLKEFKRCTNLESLDLKSSLPVSPTFFGRFEFPDPLLLRLPTEVEEFISNLGNCDSNKTEIAQ